MVEQALAALHRALTNQLTSETLWGGRVYADSVAAEIVRPYVVWFLVGGGETNLTQAQDADFDISVKVVADTQRESFEGAARLSELLNDAGTQDDIKTINAGTVWQITTITQGRVIHLKEMFAGAQPIYHDGYVFRVVMQRK